jgi:hypothetical protein
MYFRFLSSMKVLQSTPVLSATIMSMSLPNSVTW